jgi:ABC-2 type transport system permease protein
MNIFKDLYNYRELLKSNIKKDIRGKYKGSFLGVLWSFINPLLMTLVYAIVFPYLMRGAGYEHYTTFLIIGILPWNWFTMCISQGTSTILANAGIIKKVYFPREILPISSVISGLVNFLISCIVMALFIICSGIGFNKYIIFLPFIILTQFLLSLAIVFITSAVNIYIRDLEYIVNFLLQMLFYATPILYSMDLFAGSKVGNIIQINPMTIIINSYRNILYWGTIPQIKSLIAVFLGSILLCFIGLNIFRKLSKGFAEEV